MYKDDWMYFMLGKYSKFSTVLKRAIKTYYGKTSAEYKYLDSFLNPEEYFNKYADLLQIDVDVLKNVGELCNPCNKDKETLKISLENLEVLQENQ
jgi:transcription initiation factor TFIIIB Brf1 subunit/transcription initiation factor TFIIB